jgi:deferrochelatase/peroxidase EfeB
MTIASLDFSNVQGLARFGHGLLTEASLLLLKIRDAKAARAWLAAAPITTAVDMVPPPSRAMQVAFTRQGLQEIGVAHDVLAQFSAEFVSGMTGQESRSRRLGDVGTNSPHLWRWGSLGNVPHVLLMLYAREGQLEEWVGTVQGPLWSTAFELERCLKTSNMHNKEPFGFADGISQPTPDWKRERAFKGDALKYGNEVALGEVLLGYPNEYGKYTQRPLVNPDPNRKPILPFAEDVPTKLDLGRDGTFLVLRQLEQDVRGFWRFLDREVGSIRDARRELAESMVGRRMDGTPLLPDSGSIAGINQKSAAQNQFTFETDPNGIRCPLGAHIRRTNPRNADLPNSENLFSRILHTLGFGNAKYSDDVIASARFHRIIRRGREYGSELTPDAAVADSEDTEERGIYFICIAANILRQFEFVQNSWLMGTKFDALTDESDPLLGNRAAIPGCPVTNTFTAPQESPPGRRILDVPQFVTVRGGAYFFLPSISALRYLASNN